MSWNKETILEILANPEATTNGKPNSYLIYRMLLALYNRQTLDEKAKKATQWENGVGFNAFDSTFLSQVAVSAEQYMKDKPNKYGLSKGQAKVVAAKLKKYIRQLIEISEANSKGNSEAKAQNTQHKLEMPEENLPPQLDLPKATAKQLTYTNKQLVEKMVAWLRLYRPDKFFNNGGRSLKLAMSYWPALLSINPLKDQEFWEWLNSNAASPTGSQPPLF